MSSLPFAKKSLGQHWLSDIDSLQAICDSADLSPNDTVLEIGPGMGHLTKLLVRKVAQVIAVELDKELVDALPTQVPAANLQIVNQDILSFDLTTLPSNYKIVANIPYYLTSHLIRVMSESANPPCLAVLLIQKEVAQRICAEPGDMSLLSITAQFYWETSLGRTISSKLFTPPPKVDSQILILKSLRSNPFPDVDAKTYFRIVKAGFSGRRKTLLNSLSAGLRLPKAEVSNQLKLSKIDSGTRAQNLSLEDWYWVYRVFAGTLPRNT